MNEVSRRKIMGLAALAPLAWGLLRGDAEAKQATQVHAKAWGQFPDDASARAALARRFFPNVSLFTQDGKRVSFYDDLVKGKIVTINFFYTHCDKVCPKVTSNLAKVQKLFGDRVGRELFMNSITLKPEEDSPRVLKQYADENDAKPGWAFLTGKPEDIELLRKSLGFTYPNPVIDKDKSQHIGNVRYGNEPRMFWSACPGMAHARWIAKEIKSVMPPYEPYKDG